MGRRQTYERPDVLRAATALFQAQGFHGVSVEDIISDTGLNRFAIYEKFGGKEGLFYDTLDFYLDVIIRQQLLGPLRQDNGSLDVVLDRLRIMQHINQDGSRRSGCLIVNANIELGGTDPRVTAGGIPCFSLPRRTHSRAALFGAARRTGPWPVGPRAS